MIAVRHCSATGQESDAPLTEEGCRQAQKLAHFLKRYNFNILLSSPFKRAIDTIKPYAELTHNEIKTDKRLAERVLSTQTDPNWDWKFHLERTYKEEHLKFPGGESSFEAKQRIHSLIKELEDAGHHSVLLVTHGNLMSMLISLYEPSFEFKEWELLTNPDVFMIDSLSKDVTRLSVV